MGTIRKLLAYAGVAVFACVPFAWAANGVPAIVSTSETSARTGIPVGPLACQADSFSRYAVPATSK